MFVETRPISSADFDIDHSTLLGGCSGARIARLGSEEFILKLMPPHEDRWSQGELHPEARAVALVNVLRLDLLNIWHPGVMGILDGIALPRIRNFHGVRHADLKKITVEQIAAITVLDILLGNTDRHTGNIGMTPDGALWLIDHGICAKDMRWSMRDSTEFYYQARLLTEYWADTNGADALELVLPEIDRFCFQHGIELDLDPFRARVQAKIAYMRTWR